MKLGVNLTTGYDDTSRFRDTEDLSSFLETLDGVELMCLDEPDKGLVTPKQVLGLHMSSYYNWLDFWEGNEEGFVHDFGSVEAAESFFGGTSRQTIVDRYRKDLENAHRYEAEYVVFHVTDAWTEEFFTLTYHRSDEEVLEVAAEVINQVFADEDGSLALLMENLWYPGLNFMRPELAMDLLQSIDYSNAGFMLDTGHLLHTNLDLKSEQDGIDYLHEVVDRMESIDTLLDRIRGIHLHQSITGSYAKSVMANPPVLSRDLAERSGQVFRHAFTIDQHRPFSCPEVAKVVKRIAPDYLVNEFITESREELQWALHTQMAALREGGLEWEKDSFWT